MTEYNFSKRIYIDRYSRTVLRMIQKKKLDFEVIKSKRMTDFKCA